MLDSSNHALEHMPSPLQIDDGRAGKLGIVDSLNVSVATGILLHRLLSTQAPLAAAEGSSSNGSEEAAEAEEAILEA